jgi:hypothetical protein
MQEVEIFENSSWSCVHAGLERGVARPLRAALDWLRDTLAGRFEEKAREFLKDTWTARDEYIDVVRDGSPASQSSFLNRHAAHALNDAERVTALNLLELQRHLMLMYTSCGCFFDEISGIERVQVIQYACRAVQLSQEVLGNHVESEFLQALAQAKSNLPEQGDGAAIYRKSASPAAVNLERLGPTMPSARCLRHIRSMRECIATQPIAWTNAAWMPARCGSVSAVPASRRKLPWNRNNLSTARYISAITT